MNLRPFDNDDPSLMDSLGLNKLRNYLREKSGLVFEGVQLEMLKSRLLNRMKTLRMRTLSDYYFYLRYSVEGRQELSNLVDTITINETYFFRNPRQFEFFERKVMPWAIETRKKQGIPKILGWSAGCSTGEEPYSLAMCIRDALGNRHSDFRTHVYASDINFHVLETAKQRRYSEWALRHMPDQKRIRYMEHVDAEQYYVSDTIAQMVHYEQRNLLSQGIPDPHDLDVIFCRNVLIYFDASDLPGIVMRFYDALRPGGFLFLGHSESLHNITGAFDIVLEPGVVAYRKAPD